MSAARGLRLASDGVGSAGARAPDIKIGRIGAAAGTPLPALHGEGSGVGPSAALIPPFRGRCGGESPSPFPQERGREISLSVPLFEVPASRARTGVGGRVGPGLAASLLAHAVILAFSLTALNSPIEAPPPEPFSVEVEIDAPPPQVARDAPPPAEVPPPPLAETPAPPPPAPAVARDAPPPVEEIPPPAAEAPKPPSPKPAELTAKEAPPPAEVPPPVREAPAPKPPRSPPSAPSTPKPAKAAKPAEPRPPSPRTPAPVRARSAAADPLASPVAPPPVAGAAAAYREAVYARLAARTRYPEAAMETRPRGVAMVRFSLDASGQVTSAALARSAGDETLDADAVSTVRRASPFPPPPPGAPRDFTAPLSYRPR